MKVAKLVYISLMTRVVVDSEATEDQIIAAAMPRFIDDIETGCTESIEQISDDLECPYDPDTDFGIDHEFEVRCNMCNWEGDNEDLALFEYTVEDGQESVIAVEYSDGKIERYHTSEPGVERNFFKGCPNCETDNYLMDLKEE